MPISFFGVIAGPAILAIAAVLTIAHFLYGSALWPPGAIAVTLVGVAFTVAGVRAGEYFKLPSTSVAFYFFLLFFGLTLAVSLLRSYPWSATEIALLLTAAILGTSGYLGLRSGARRTASNAMERSEES